MGVTPYFYGLSARKTKFGIIKVSILETGGPGYSSSTFFNIFDFQDVTDFSAEVTAFGDLQKKLKVHFMLDHGVHST